jgi:hypothetical protein
MNHPQIILRCLDSFLERETRIVLYGRAALALGFGGAGEHLAVTRDVAAILPALEMQAIETDEQFWRALDRTNRALEDRELYITHLFTDDQVILTPDWLSRIAPIDVDGLRWLRPYRPDAADLILTKMMRRDPQDLADIQFLLEHGKVGSTALERALLSARCPDLREIEEAFEALKPVVLELAKQMESRRRT